MRLWSLHPKYLDSIGLVALWREALLAKNVLEEKTKGYKHHPQLIRFKNSHSPLDAINYYLSCVHKEAKLRKFNFEQSKFYPVKKISNIPLSSGQLAFEMKHLKLKLKQRSLNDYYKIKTVKTLECHPLFIVFKGNIEDWEKIIESNLYYYKFVLK